MLVHFERSGSNLWIVGAHGHY